jgi:arylsulfatase
MTASFLEDIVIPHDYLWWFHEGNRAIRVGDWKLVSEGMTSPWELYNLAHDRSETRDLSESEPLRVQTLADKWNAVLGEFTSLALSSPH